MEYTHLLKFKYFCIKREDKVIYFYRSVSHLKLFFKVSSVWKGDKNAMGLGTNNLKKKTATLHIFRKSFIYVLCCL